MERGSGPILLLTPVIAILFGMLIMLHERQIGQVSLFIRDNIELPLLEHYPNSMGWHSTKARMVRRQRRLPDAYVPLILIMVVPSAAGFSLAWTFRNPLELTIPLALASVGLLTAYSFMYMSAVNLNQLGLKRSDDVIGYGVSGR